MPARIRLGLRHQPRLPQMCGRCGSAYDLLAKHGAVAGLGHMVDVSRADAVVGQQMIHYAQRSTHAIRLCKEAPIRGDDSGPDSAVRADHRRQRSDGHLVGHGLQSGGGRRRLRVCQTISTIPSRRRLPRARGRGARRRKCREKRLSRCSGRASASRGHR